MAIKMTAIRTTAQLIPLKLIRKPINTTGTKALIIPNRMAPSILAATNVLRLIGANNNLSKDLLLFSKVIVTASIDVVPNNILMAIKPGSNSITSIFPDERISCIKVQERGKIMPQLMFGGFR